jgi:hypothetical protein
MSVLKNQLIADLRALFGSKDDGVGGTYDLKDQVERAFRKELVLNLDPSTNALVNTTKRHVFYAKSNITISEVKYVPDGTLTVASNSALMRLYSGNGAAAAATQVGLVNTATGSNWAAGTPVSLTLTAANCNIDAGKTLAVEILKVGTAGIAVPKGSLVIHYIER